MKLSGRQVRTNITPSYFAGGDGSVTGNLLGIDAELRREHGASASTNVGNTFQLTVTDRIMKVNPNGADRTSNATTPLIGGNAGDQVVVVNVGANNLTFKSATNLVTPGNTDVVLAPNGTFMAFCFDGTKWYVTAKT